MFDKVSIYRVGDKVGKLFFLDKLLFSFSGSGVLVEILSKNSDLSTLYKTWLETRSYHNNLKICYSTGESGQNFLAQKRVYTDIYPDMNISGEVETYILSDKIDEEFLLKNERFFKDYLLDFLHEFDIPLDPDQLCESSYFLKNQYFPCLSIKLSNDKTLTGFAGGYFELFHLGEDVIKTKISGREKFPEGLLELCVRIYKKNFAGLVDGIVYIPSTKYGVLMERFAHEFSSNCKLPILSLLEKKHGLMEQKKLDKLSHRHQNMSEAFRCRLPDSIPGKSILLLDDVWASGATMCKTSEYLYSLGAKKIYALAIVKKDRQFN